MEVAIIKTGALGDVVRTTSLVPALAARFPDVRLTWITSPPARPLLAFDPRLQAVTIDDAPAAEWRSVQYDWVISLDDDVASCRLASALHAARLSGASLSDDGERVYSSDLDQWFGMGLLRPGSRGGLADANALKRRNTRTYGEILYNGLCLPLPVQPPCIYVPEPARARATEWLRPLRGLGAAVVGLNTGASGRWRLKQWGAESTAILARQLADDGWAVAILGGPAERTRNEMIWALADHPRVWRAPTEMDLLVFAALVGACDIVVSSDSLALHLAVAAGRPAVAFFGTTSDAEIDLFGRGRKIVTSAPCRRCYLSSCELEPSCMDVITPELLIDAVRAQAAFPRRATDRREALIPIRS